MHEAQVSSAGLTPTASTAPPLQPTSKLPKGAPGAVPAPSTPPAAEDTFLDAVTSISRTTSGAAGDAASSPLNVLAQTLSNSTLGGSSEPLHSSAAVGGEGGPAKPAKPQPMHLLLDVQLDAPVITMPKTSSSPDYMEVDLGRLDIRNTIAYEEGSSAVPGHGTLLDNLEVGGAGVSCAPVLALVV